MENVKFEEGSNFKNKIRKKIKKIRRKERLSCFLIAIFGD